MKVTNNLVKTPINKIKRLIPIKGSVIISKFIYAPKLPNKIDD